MIKNRKAYFNYEIIDEIEAGIVLKGTEVKSIRLGKVDMSNAFCVISDDYQIYIHQLKINPYPFGNLFNHTPNRVKKLLLHKREIIKISQKVQPKGLTLIPLKLYFKRGNIKITLGMCKGRKIHDKEKLIKARDLAMKKSHQF